MELKQYAALLLRWLWLILLGTMLAAAAAFAVSSYSTPVYEASTTLLINQAPASSASPDYTSLLTSERLARTYAELLQKRPVFQEVIDTLDLAISPGDLAANVRVTAVRDTQLIVVTVEDTNPDQAAAIANEIVAVFSQKNRALQTSRYAASKESLGQELAKVQADIDRTQVDMDVLDANIVRNQDKREQLQAKMQVNVTLNQGTLRILDANIARDLDKLERLQAVLAQHRSSYTSLLESLEGIHLAEAQTTDSISVVEEAVANPVPVRPRTLMNTLLGAIVGGMLAVGVVFLIEYLDDSVKSREQVEELTHASTLAAIASISGKELPDKLVSAVQSRSPIAEAYRLLRTNLEFSAIGGSLRALLVTSSTPGEGKSTTAANLAIVLAQAGKQVILVDTDLRRPSLHKFFQRTNVRGFTTALLQQSDVSLDDCLLPTSITNLRLLPSGPLPPNPAELLASPRMLELVEELKTHADIILFDSPPLLVVSDATLLSRMVDGTLLVVLTASTRASVLRRAYEQLAQSGSRLLGVVLNKVSTARSSYYYDYYSYHYYGQDQKRKKRGHKTPLPAIPFYHSTNGNGRNDTDVKVDAET